jgi:hypothetical protein
MASLDRRTLATARHSSLKRLAKWLGMKPKAERNADLVERVVRHLDREALYERIDAMGRGRRGKREEA